MKGDTTRIGVEELGMRERMKQRLFRNTVKRVSPHYRKVELWFSIYTSSATVCRSNMKRNMVCKTKSS